MSNYTSYELERLLSRIVKGDELAFNHLVEYFRNDLYVHALTYTKSPEFAEELVLDIFMKVWKNRGQLGTINNFKNYLFIIGRNQIISAMRKRLGENKQIAGLKDLEEEVLVPHKQLEAKEIGLLVQRGIASLPPQQKIAFTLSRMEAKSYEEIAAIMGITKRTVNFHMVCALNTLREFLRYRGMVLLTACLILNLF